MKIQVVGLSGVGKTTISKKISKSLNLKYVSIDDILYLEKFSKKNTHKTINKKVSKVFKEKNFILDGTFLNFKYNDYKRFDLIIIIEIGLLKNIFYIIKRFLKFKKYRKLFVLKNIYLNFKTRFLKASWEIQEHNTFIKKNCKFVVLKNYKDERKVFEILKNLDK